MKCITILICCLLLIGCPSNPADDNSVDDKYKTKCIDGVVYMFFDNYNYNQGFGYMSVKYDKITKQVVTCS